MTAVNTNQAELVVKIARSLETSIRGTFIKAGTIQSPKHVYRVDDPRSERNLPFCLNHSFANIRHLGSRAYGNQCATGYEEQFEVIIGACSPIAMMRQSGKKLKESVYGKQPTCGEGIELKEPSQGQCVVPELVDGQLVWPENSDESWTYENFGEYLLYQRILLRSNLIKVFCQTLDRCLDVPGKANFNFTRIDPWAVGNFQGTIIVVSGTVG